MSGHFYHLVYHVENMQNKRDVFAKLSQLASKKKMNKITILALIEVPNKCFLCFDIQQLELLVWKPNFGHGRKQVESRMRNQIED